ncbi:MAG: hypothetical protein ACLP8X_22815 [Streptosporangiaceae bacterium]
MGQGYRAAAQHGADGEGRPLARAAVAAGLLLAVLGLALGGVRASALAQLLLVALVIAVVVTAVPAAMLGPDPMQEVGPLLDAGAVYGGRTARSRLLGLAPSDSDNRRVIAAIRYLES